MKRLCRLAALALAVLMTLSALAFAETAACPPVETGIRGIQKYGNLILDISGNAFLALGYEYGDVIAADIGGSVCEMPVCYECGDVDSGAMVCRVIKADSADDSYVILAINSGDLATWLGIAARTSIEADPGFRWDLSEAYADGVPVTLTLREKGGYLEELGLNRAVMTSDRADYPHLTDAQYANFRNVATTGMGANVLYRSSSPVNPAYNRNKEADAAVNAAGIRTAMNMADSEAVMKGYPDYAYSYYSKLDVVPLDLITDFEAQSFRDGLAEGFRFLAAHEGPYLVHCTVGKDRSGFACAVLEALMGASADEIVADYMLSYYNYYGMEPGSSIYKSTANSNILKTLPAAFGLETLDTPDLPAAAEAYLQSIGMTPDEIATLKAKLGT